MNNISKKQKRVKIKNHNVLFKFIRSLFKSKGALTNGLLYVGVVMSILIMASYSMVGYTPASPYEKPEPTITPTPTIAPPFPLPSDYGRDNDHPDNEPHDDDHHEDPK